MVRMATIVYGAVRCRFLLMFARCGAVRVFFSRCGAVRVVFFLESYDAVQCGSVRGTIVLCGAVRLNRTEPHRTVRKKRTVRSLDIIQAAAGIYPGLPG